MKILVFSDLHCNVAAATAIVEAAPGADCVIGAGDFSICRTGIEKTIDVLRRIERPTVLVPGNGESLEELQAACEGWSAVHILHGSGIVLQGVSMFGIGGGIPPTPFGSWSYDFTEEQATELLAECPPGGVLISHSPPRGIVDVSSMGTHLGSVAVRAVVERNQPRLVVCGHVHESWRRQEQLGRSLIVNAGPQPILLDLELS